MEQSSLERVGRARELLNCGLQPFVEHEMKAVPGDRGMDAAQESQRDSRPSGGSFDWDTQAILGVMWDQWQTVFKNTLG